MADFDVLIRNGMIVDGALNPRYRGDVAIRDGIIVELGRVRGSASRELDATGLVVAPGFVDLHTHYDAQVFWDPYCSLSGWHGVTSVAIGNCGFGFAPVRAADREQAMRTLTRVEAIPLEAMRAGLPWSWESFAGFLDTLERTAEGRQPAAVRSREPAPHVGHGSRARQGRRAPHRRRARARWPALLDDAMEAGAFGWSAQRLQPSFERSVQRDHDGTPDAQRRDARRDVPRPRGRARRPQRGRHPDDARVGRPQGRRRALRGTGRDQRRTGALQRRRR